MYNKFKQPKNMNFFAISNLYHVSSNPITSSSSQDPSLPDIPSDPFQFLQNGSDRSTSVPSPTTSQDSSPPPSLYNGIPHLYQKPFDEYLYDTPQAYEAPSDAKYRYKCTISSCSQRFKEYLSLISHLRIHHRHHGKGVLNCKKMNCKKTTGKAM